MFESCIDFITPVCDPATLMNILSQLFGSCFVEKRKQHVNNAIDLPPYMTSIPEEYFPFIQYIEGMSEVMHGRNHNPRSIVFKSLNDTSWKLTFICIFNKTLLPDTGVIIRNQLSHGGCFQLDADHFVSSIRKYVEDGFDANHIYYMTKFTPKFNHSFMTRDRHEGNVDVLCGKR